MKTVYKYELPSGGTEILLLPQNFKKLHLGLDPLGQMCMWAEVDTENLKEYWIIFGVGTGWPIDELTLEENNPIEYMGTINDGICYMWHYYGRKMSKEEVEKWREDETL